ncbi:CoA-binding protein, partial [Candidatus Bathyarchaeota archaeon]|nr:CoA-binding protein [Candidatus Bathyarchaeota archaeon]
MRRRGGGSSNPRGYQRWRRWRRRLIESSPLWEGSNLVRFIDGDTRVLVQGITGTQGSFHTRLMLDYGSRVVAGVTPGRGGMVVEGVPVFDTVAGAQDRHEIDASILFIPARFVLDPALEAIDAGLDPVVVITEGVPVRDTMEIVANARLRGTTIIGPNCPGIIKPGEV